MEAHLYIQNGQTVYEPVVEGAISWVLQRRGQPGKCSFTLIPDSNLVIEEGNAIRLDVNGKSVFFGFIFERSWNHDGKMKVTFTLADGQEAPALDASVKVQLPDGTTKSGTVAAISGSDITVTFSDNGPVPGETATVLSSDGATTYGQGEMAINRSLEVMGTDGTVSSVSISVDSYVYSGSTLVTLTSKPASSDYESLYASRQEKAETLRTLLNYAQGNTVTAPVDGVVQSLPGGENTGLYWPMQTVSHSRSISMNWISSR